MRDGRTIVQHHALNDIVVHKGGHNRVLRLAWSVDGAEVGSYVADGLIAATPTGATGYSLSAGGPLVVPSLDVVIATLICPHALGVRPIVLAGQQPIEIHLEHDGGGAGLSFDGQVEERLETGDRIVIERSERVVRLVGLDMTSYFDHLRTAFSWGRRADRTR